MIVEYIRYSVTEDRAADLIAAYVAAQEGLAASEHSLGYDVAQCTEDLGQVVVRMAWDSAEGHLKGFRSSPAFRDFFTLVRPFTDAITEMRHYQVVAGPGLPASDPATSMADQGGASGRA